MREEYEIKELEGLDDTKQRPPIPKEGERKQPLFWGVGEFRKILDDDDDDDDAFVSSFFFFIREIYLHQLIVATDVNRDLVIFASVLLVGNRVLFL